MRWLLIRHGESTGNIDELAYTRTPDHSLELTTKGREQARAAGTRIRQLLDNPTPHHSVAYLSPYLRVKQTFTEMNIADLCAATIGEPRLREQDWGNLQDPEDQQRQRELRNEFGHFYYRLPHGESGADVDDRVAAFLSDLITRSNHPDFPPNVLIITHGLAMRLLVRRLLGWSIDLFESLSNPDNCEHRILERTEDGWTLDRPFDQWRESPDGTTQTGRGQPFDHWLRT